MGVSNPSLVISAFGELFLDRHEDMSNSERTCANMT